MTNRPDTAARAVLRTVVLSVTLLAAGGGTLALATDGFQAFTTETARRIAVRRHPVVLPIVPLEDQSGAQFTLADLRGRWLLVDFIYTRCQTLCSVLGGDFADLQRQLAVPIAEGKVRFLSISFDPTHDTPPHLAGYLTRFGARGPGWQAARPLTSEGLRRLTTAFGITVIPDRQGGYTHNAAINVVDPDGRLVDMFDLDQRDQARDALLRRLLP
jgi:protein SCO1/2